MYVCAVIVPLAVTDAALIPLVIVADAALIAPVALIVPLDVTDAALIPLVIATDAALIAPVALIAPLDVTDAALIPLVIATDAALTAPFISKAYPLVKLCVSSEVPYLFINTVPPLGLIVIGAYLVVEPESL